MKWDAFVIYDPESGERLGVYETKDDAEQDCPGWKDEGYKIAPCTIVLERLKAAKKR